MLMLYILNFCYGDKYELNNSMEVLFFLDNAEVLSRGLSNAKGRNISLYLKNDYDYWRLLRSLITSLPFSINLQKIKSHNNNKSLVSVNLVEHCWQVHWMRPTGGTLRPGLLRPWP